MKRERGVTLLELLVAVSLLSLLSVGILFALRVGFNSMQKANSKLMANRRVLGVERLIENQIAGYMPVHADCKFSPEAPAVSMPYFQGDPDSMRFVSNYSMQEAGRGYPRILEYQVIPGDNGNGVRLVVNEFLYSGGRSTGASCIGQTADPLTGLNVAKFAPVQVGPASFILADKLAFCRILYKEEFPAPAPVRERWAPKWTHQRPPSAVRIQMEPLERDPSRVQLIAITAPFRITRDPMKLYVD
ncbi:MAG TPA: prepilin-type N-terminal cleavage/methylation domain-containing protein [Bryobacteraceae bacterium]|nr:prepilin-type N-terminal cleavage/methylation domain-containing protein [Bryobacteraceae bacterium]